MTASKNLRQDDDLVELRVPRSALTLIQGPPAHVSQKTSERETGIPRGVFLDLAREYGRAGGAVIATCKLRIVQREPFLAWLATRSQVSTPADKTPDEADVYAAELGLRAVPNKGGHR